MITELQARSMSNEQVLDVIKKSCCRCKQTLIHATYNPITLGLVILVDKIVDFGGVEADVDSVLIGLCDFDFNPVEDDRLNIHNEPCCPATIVTCNESDYFELAKATGGVSLV